MLKLHPPHVVRGRLRRSRATLAALALAAAVVSACSSDDGTDVTAPLDDGAAATPRNAEMMAAAPGDIIDVAVAADDFTILAAALEATDLVATLGDDDALFTVFAPTDAAFEALGQDAIDALLAAPDTLRDILLYHVVADAVVDAETALSLAGTTVETANGDSVALTVDGEQLRINMSNVIATDIFATNGVIHVIDAVLTPPPAALDTDGDGIPDADDSIDDRIGTIVDVAIAAGGFDTLVTALQATGLDAVLADNTATFTVFAPTDDAFAALGDDAIAALLADPDALSDILLYHVLAGQAVDGTTALSLAGQSVETANGASIALSIRDGALFVNDSEVTITDVAASNGVIHVIDRVLTPPADAPAPIEPAPPVAAGGDAGTLLDVARAAGDFTILVAAIEATGLDAAIGHPDDLYTVFAPTDAAFRALGQDTIDALLADPDTLRDILLYHVLPGRDLDAADALSLIGVPLGTGNGASVDLSLREGSLFVNDAAVIATDIRGVNGIIHVIDAVLLPPAR